MEFAEYPTYDANGVIIAYRLELDNTVIEKGKRLTAADIRAIRSAGMTKIAGYKTSHGDIPKELAINMIASHLIGKNCSFRQESDQRITVYAEKKGLINYNQERLKRVNNNKASITASFLSQNSLVKSGQVIAYIDAFCDLVEEKDINDILSAVSGLGALLEVSTFENKKIGIIQTRLPGVSSSGLELKKLLLKSKIENLGGKTCFEDIVIHDSDEIENKIRQAISNGATIVIIDGIQPVQSIKDVIPLASQKAGFDDVGFLIPVDVGGEIYLSKHEKQNVYLLTTPKDADKTQECGLDLVLRRLFADIEIQQKDMLDMGAFFDKSYLTPVNLENFDDLNSGSPAKSGKNVAAIILAAGRGARFGGDNKLLKDNVPQKDETPLFLKTVDEAIFSKASPIIVVTGFEAELIEKHLFTRDVKIIRNPNFITGVKTSIEMGINTLPKSINGAVIIPADMPGVSSDHINKLIDAFEPKEKKKLCVTIENGIRKNPVLWSSNFFNDATLVPENSHIRPTFLEHSDVLCEVKAKNKLIVCDINSHGDYMEYLELLKSIPKEIEEKEDETQTITSKDKPDILPDGDDIIYL